ncbi:hypothetical protein GDO78_005262 [Eleutherodactylus coqui]|uniref:Uncharacterized protein n=1 Tax=Eleutherodactylus coqui TaxID=57060 RepID=A0A8J6KEY7_ELECQ|nr:hypothetical protein GDO78_005262 [Eleutherodactylus coqui]
MKLYTGRWPLLSNSRGLLGHLFSHLSPFTTSPGTKVALSRLQKSVLGAVFGPLSSMLPTRMLLCVTGRNKRVTSLLDILYGF